MPRKVEQLVSDYLSLAVELEAKIWRARSEDVDEQRERPIASGRDDTIAGAVEQPRDLERLPRSNGKPRLALRVHQPERIKVRTAVLYSRRTAPRKTAAAERGEKRESAIPFPLFMLTGVEPTARGARGDRPSPPGHLVVEATLTQFPSRSRGQFVGVTIRRTNRGDGQRAGA
jgi:hypothetical protein